MKYWPLYIAAGGAGSAFVFPWAEIFKGVLGVGGVHPALFLLVVGGLVAAIVVLARAFQKSEDNRDSERANESKNVLAIQEKRIEEGKAMLLALERTSAALAAHTAALESRTTAINEMVQALARMAQNQEATKEHFNGVATRLEGGLSHAHKLLDDLRGR